MLDTKNVFQVFWIKPQDDVNFGYINVWSNIKSPSLEIHYGGPQEYGGAPIKYEEWRDWIESNPQDFEVTNPDYNTVKATRVVHQEEPEAKEPAPAKKTKKGRKAAAK